jgi:hypothetical protein
MSRGPMLGQPVEKKKRFPKFQRLLNLFEMWTRKRKQLLLLIADHLEKKLCPPALAAK